MNKIYKLIWNKVRNCYVAVSEIAKRNGKCGAVVDGATSVCGDIRAKDSCGMSGARVMSGLSCLCRSVIHQGRVVLALTAVLWIATGWLTVSRAEAFSNGHLLYLDAGDGHIHYDRDYNWGGQISPPDGATVTAVGKTLSVTGGDWKFGTYTVSSPSPGWNLNGGYNNASTSNLTGYTLNVTGIKKGNSIFGAWAKSGSGNVADNHVIIKNSTVGDESAIEEEYAAVAGGYATEWFSEYGNAENNTVAIENSTVNANIYGGCSEGNGNAVRNAVTISATSATPYTIKGSVYGGRVNPGIGTGLSGSATGNSVIIDGGENKSLVINGGIAGGYVASGKGTATGNSVTIRNAMVSGNVYGSYAPLGNDTTGNIVTLDGATIGGEVDGGTNGGSSPRQNWVKGNILQLSGVNTVTNVQGLETIALLDTLQWAPGNEETPTLKVSQKIYGYGLGDQTGNANLNLDVSAVATKWTTPGTMTLIKAKQLPSNIYLIGDIGQGKITNHGITVYQGAQTKSDDGSGVTLEYKNTHTVIKSGNIVSYDVQNIVNTITLGTVKWNSYWPTARIVSSEDAEKLLLVKSNVISNRQPPILNATNLAFTCNNASVLPKKGDTMRLLGYYTSFTVKEVQPRDTYPMAYTDTTGIQFNASAAGTFEYDGQDLNYKITGDVTVDSVDLAKWNGKDTAEAPAGWDVNAAGITVYTDGMTNLPILATGESQEIITAPAGSFKLEKIEGANKYGSAFADNLNGVTIAGQNEGGIRDTNNGATLTFFALKKNVDTVTLGQVDFVKGATLLDRRSVIYDYTGVAALGTDGFAVSYESPETVAAGDSMTLLQANATLKDMAEQVKKTSYSYTPVEGVTVDANITGKLAASGGAVTYTAAENQASKLTFTKVDWKDSGALLTRPSNITFAGADVDTTKIHFKNVKELDANKKMTLVSDFGDSVGTITGTKYTVGAGLEGEGAASLSGSDLIFTTKTGANDLAAQEQTHNTLMVMEAGMAVLAAGNEYVGQTMAELANPQNVSLDGTVTAASLGGSKSRYKTGSHVDSNNWNVAVAVGSKRELKKGSLEWGVFGEYGKSNYTLRSDAGRGDGDSHYAGGGLMAKWTNKHDVYTEASVRLGRLSDTASNLLRDAAGNGYGYDVHANYFGAHVGIGKIIHYKGGKSLDVYGKYFYTKRDGVDFTSGGNNYSLDSVASSVLRVGARYGTTDKKWNWYGGLAYEYEFDGKSEGTVDGVGIRAASVKGGSVRGEIGLRMSATKTNPWQTDISIYGYGGKHRGFGGSVNVAYMF